MKLGLVQLTALNRTLGRCHPSLGRCGYSSSISQGGDSSDQLPKGYDAVKVEPKWLERWTRRKSLERKDGTPVFRMILPPPNVTGRLHLGHALTIAIEDTIARWKNMQGYKVEWIPGFDHAGIATHSVAMRKYQKEFGDKMDQGEFQRKLQQVAQSNLSSIKEQLQSLGPLLNWDSLYYTLDENHSNVVKEAFVALFEMGIIQRGDGIVNWSCSLQSTVSDVEIDDIGFKGRITLKVPQNTDPIEFGVLYYCSYQLENSDEHLTVATSRPETMFGDVALAVNPADARYAGFVGRRVVNPTNNTIIPVIVDERVKTDFGTGIVKITPAHDRLDFAIGVSHGLPRVDVLTKNGMLNELAGAYSGVPRFAARNQVLKDLQDKGALKGKSEYSGAVSLCNRTGDVIEPKILPHWFLRTEKLTNSFLDSVKSKEFVISPDNYATDLLHSLSNCQDWCLSRQISWGHRIPMYRHTSQPETWVSAFDIPTARRKLEERHGINIKDDSELIQDQDVLDTWFSSALIPLAISGWPDAKEPKIISLMETGYDILLFWVWRMVIATLGLSGHLPFKHVLLHGIVSDKYGRKMSKSKGNVIDPLHIINGITYENLFEEAKTSLESGELEPNEFELRTAAIGSEYPQGFKGYGRDALRFALLSQNIKSQQINLDVAYLDNCRHFTNKLWQALRFFSLYRKHYPSPAAGTSSEPKILAINSAIDKWLLACLYDFSVQVEKHLDSGNFHLYTEAIRKFFYQQLCDVYIELVKNDLRTGTDAEQHLLVMEYALRKGIQLSHPLLPFVTEEIWSQFSSDEFLIDQKFPTSRSLESFRNPELNNNVMKAIKLVKEIRSMKARIGMKGTARPLMFFDAPTANIAEAKAMKTCIENLAGCHLTFDSPNEEDKYDLITMIIQLDGKICKISTPKGESATKYLEKEQKKISKLQAKLAKLKQQYENPNFQQYASDDVKAKLRKQLETLEVQINAVLAASSSSDTENPKRP